MDILCINILPFLKYQIFGSLPIMSCWIWKQQKTLSA